MASVGISNRFDLLDDERPARVAKPAPAAAEPAAAPKPAPKKEGGDNRRQRGNKRNDKPRRDGENAERRGGRGGGRGGRGGGRGRGRGARRDGDSDGENRAPRRDFDRRSGTGRNDREKRQGGGSYSWGVEGEVVTPELTLVPIAETPAVEETPVAEAPAAEAAEPEEEEDNTITYEQLLAQKAANAVDADRKQGRQVKNDGQWQEAVEVKFEKHIDLKVQEDQAEERRQKNRKALSFDEFVTTKAKGRGGRGRGGRNEQRGRQGGRADRVKLDDESAFPALGQN